LIIDTVDDENNPENGLNIGVYVTSVALEAFTSAIINNDSAHYDMVHYIDDHVIIYDRFNEIVSLIFEMELNLSKQSLVTPQYII
jgi:hypothetical protein